MIQGSENGIWTIPNFWSTERCEALVSKSEELGFSDALVNTGSGYRKVSQVRNNERVVFTDKDLALELWHEVHTHLPLQLGNSEAVELNEVFRCYKYHPGQVFKRHRDQSFLRDNGDASYITFMIYLNDSFKGGATHFQHTSVIPKQGTCLLFLHDLEHEGAMVTEGIKYVLRTDVMYRLKRVQ